MGKRKETKPEEVIEEDVEDIVNVDFDFFDIVDDDFLSIKSLLRQLLGLDSVHFNLSAISQLIVDSKLGTTIKADDEEYNDALAVLSVSDFSVTEGETARLYEYYIERANAAMSNNTPGSAELLRALRKIQANNSSAKVGMLISERFLNMPFEVVPPLYQLLVQEYAARGLQYDYILLPSRVYSERPSNLDNNGASSTTTIDEEFFPFHPEDPFIGELAVAHARFPFQTPIDETDSRRAFQDNGIYPYGQLILIDAKRLPEIAQAIANIS